MEQLAQCNSCRKIHQSASVCKQTPSSFMAPSSQSHNWFMAFSPRLEYEIPRVTSKTGNLDCSSHK